MTASNVKHQNQAHGEDAAHVNPLAKTMVKQLDYEQLTNCMRCGFCLPSCPTFQQTGLEAESPRGRIALMKAVTDGLMDPDEAFEKQMDHCLGCRACEPVCPAGVEYGQLIEQTRDAVEQHRSHSIHITWLRKLLFGFVFQRQSRVKWLGRLLWLYQRSGLQAICRKTGVLNILPQSQREMEAVLPKASLQGVAEQLGTVYPAKGKRIGRVGLFRGCIMDAMFTDTNVNTAKLLSEAGFEVVIPEQQGCCGALHAHNGEMNGARSLAERNIQVFQAAEVDYIVSNAGGCGAILSEYDHLLAESEQSEGAAWFAERVKDVSQLLLEHGELPSFAVGAQDERATYQASCHLSNVMRAGDYPRRLLQHVEGLTFVEMDGADSCCGSAGTYNLTQPEKAGEILARKMEHADETKAQYLITSNPGCYLQMKLGVAKHGREKEMKVMHIVDFLYERTVK